MEGGREGRMERGKEEGMDGGSHPAGSTRLHPPHSGTPAQPPWDMSPPSEVADQAEMAISYLSCLARLCLKLCLSVATNGLFNILPVGS